MKKMIWATLFASVLCVNVAYAQDDFEAFKKQQEQGYTSYVKEVEKGVIASEADFEAYQKREKEAFEAFKKEMFELWGDFKERTQKDWVEYKETGRLRSSVDFEKGKARVEIIVDNTSEIEKAKEQMFQALVNTFNDKGSEKEYIPTPKKEKSTDKKDNKTQAPAMPEAPAPAPKPVSNKPVLDKQLPIKNNSNSEKEKLANNLVKENVKTKQVKGVDGNDRVVVYVDFDLAPDHLQTRAKEHESVIHEFARKNNINPALVFAIVHTESYFNPMAKSPANAYGLMQVVPTSGGRDAYKKVHGKDGVPTADYLFKPKNNVELGTTYMLILLNSYFSGVDDEITREYLTICAYNTGAGNVAKAYNGTFNIKKAIPLINKKTSAENYDFLISKLPYKETQDYLKKVSDRKKMYESWSK
ncbi:DUF3393 domain-containing protein [bacterium]|nr:MAG: DUF3393 domain-containing protein [bacterium]